MNHVKGSKGGLAAFIAVAGLTGILTGCGGPSLSGHTYYSVSAIDGDESSISFDGDTWKMTEDDNWYSGTWEQAENGGITLNESHGEIITLTPIEGSDGYDSLLPHTKNLPAAPHYASDTHGIGAYHGHSWSGAAPLRWSRYTRGARRGL